MKRSALLACALALFAAPAAAEKIRVAWVKAIVAGPLLIAQIGRAHV